MWIIKRQGSPYYYAQWLHADGSGRRVTASTGCMGKREAKARGKDLEAQHKTEHERRRGGYGATVAYVIAQHWVSEVQTKKWAPSALVHLTRIEKALGAERPYCLVTTRDVAAVVDGLKNELAPATINRLIAVWRRMHRQAQYAREMPVQIINWEAVKQTEPAGRTRALSPEQVQSLLNRLPDNLREIVAFAVLTGARKGQVLTLSWDRVDIGHGTVQIWKKHRRQNMPHVIHLHPVALAILKRRAKLAPAAVSAHALVFDSTNIQHGWEKAVKAEGLTDVRFHDLRHTAATWHIKAGTPLIVVSKMLGHSNVLTTQRYSHVSEDDVRKLSVGLPVALSIGDETGE